MLFFIILSQKLYLENRVFVTKMQQNAPKGISMHCENGKKFGSALQAGSLLKCPLFCLYKYSNQPYQFESTYMILKCAILVKDDWNLLVDGPTDRVNGEENNRQAISDELIVQDIERSL